MKTYSLIYLQKKRDERVANKLTKHLEKRKGDTKHHIER